MEKSNKYVFNSFQIKSFSSSNKISNNDIKEMVYHYTSPDAFLSIIKSHSIRFTDIRFLNDKSEGVYFVKCLLDFVDKYKNNYPHFTDVVYQLLKENDLDKIKKLETTNITYSDIIRLPYKRQRSFVFCTCTEADSLNMWNYYVNNGSYQGYNIGFRVYELLKTFDTPSTNIIDAFTVFYGKVLYSEKQHFDEIHVLAQTIERNIVSDIEEFRDEARAYNYAQINLRSYINTRGAFYKHPKFKSEDEFRIVIEIADDRIPRKQNDASHNVGIHNKSIQEDFCAKHGLLVPFLKIDIPANSIYRVTIAPMVEFDIAKQSLKEFISTYDFENVSIYKSSVPIRF